ncbi:MAG: nucleotidyltransferase [Bdellovibrionales bacterium]|nr:nucleotidyltransferase [Bdellovibrionales bacterium]
MSDFKTLYPTVDNSLRMRADASLEERLTRWAAPPSQTEIEKCERAERMIRDAIYSDPTLSKKKINVFAKGSYANRTNIPADSDVDIGVLNEDFFFVDYPPGMSGADFGFSTANYTFEEYFKDVARAIVNKFGSAEVTVSDKCIKVRSNSCRVDADVVPHYTHRRYVDRSRFHEGVALKSGTRLIYNWPKQDYENGVAKNERTGRGYKGLVRIFKSIRSEMTDDGIASSTNAKSYLLACLAWNVPDEYFGEDAYEAIFFDSLDYLIGMTASYANVKEWGEVNELKYLFRDAQPWKLEDVHQFLKDMKAYMEKFR